MDESDGTRDWGLPSGRIGELEDRQPRLGARSDIELANQWRQAGAATTLPRQLELLEQSRLRA
jgi:hypothetical protein